MLSWCAGSAWGLPWAIAWVGLILHRGQAGLGHCLLCPLPWGTAHLGGRECVVLAGGTTLKMQTVLCLDSGGKE